ncbi:MAG TPA: hypothetical protein VGT78_03115 [Rhizomicrobium sp.]|nr:hypothetical protein [Rhizomicrobium sp.]
MKLRTPILLCAAIALAGCARPLPSDTASYVHGVQRSASYHQGYVEGCETADYSHDRQKMRRDENKFENDPEYRLGWTAATDDCHDTVFTPSTGRPTNSAIPNVY